MGRTVLLVVVGVVALSIAGGVGWRWMSRHRSVPCPTWLALVLEGALGEILGSGTTKTSLDRLGLEPGQRVLEVGPGTGRLLIPVARRVLPGGEVVGLEIQPGMIKRLESRAKEAGVSNLTTIMGDATQGHVPPESFDVIYLCAVLGEIPDRDAAMRQCHVALKPRGRVSITEIFPDPHYQTRGTVRRLAEAAGFRLDRSYGNWLDAMFSSLSKLGIPALVWNRVLTPLYDLLTEMLGLGVPSPRPSQRPLTRFPAAFPRGRWD